MIIAIAEPSGFAERVKSPADVAVHDSSVPDRSGVTYSSTVGTKT